MDDLYIPALKAELKKMQELFFKNKKKSLKPLPKTVKCCSIRCRSTGNLDTKNVDKYGQCSRCDGREHYNCANIKEERKTKYIVGLEKFICSSCLVRDSKNAIENNSVKAITFEETLLAENPDDKEGEVPHVLTIE